MKSDKIKAQEQPTDVHADLRESDSGFVPHPGEYHLVAVDKHGNEVPGTDFSIPPKDYARTYARRANEFKVKKNPNQ